MARDSKTYHESIGKELQASDGAEEPAKFGQG